MIYSLRTQKQRIETPSGAVFYNDFSNTLHMARGEENHALALNLGTSNWTVSDKDELLFYLPSGDSAGLMLIDTEKKTRRRLPEPPEKFSLIDIIITKDRFFASIPGILVTGNRSAEGDFIWTGIKTIDLGAGYRFTLEDDGRLAFTKRGTCSVFRYDPATGRKEETPTPKRLWEMLFRNDFLPEYMPQFPGGGFPSIPELCAAFEDTAAGHHVRDIGVNAYAMLSYIRRYDADTASVLDRLFALDWQLQYSALIDEPFPSILLLHELYKYRSAEELPVTKMINVKIIRWSRIFETEKKFARQARIVRSKEFTDL